MVEDEEDEVVEAPEPDAYTYDPSPDTEVDPVVAAWARWRPEFAKVVNDGLWSIEELEDRVAAKAAIFFPGSKCALVGETIRYPTGARALHIVWAVGDKVEQLAMIPGIEAMARMMGCRRMVFDLKADDQTAMKAQGYRLLTVKLVKAL
jgi:hypothetical protein